MGPTEDSQPTVEAPHLTVQESPQTHSLDSKICALDGTNLTQLRDGLCLCSPGIVEPGKDNAKRSGGKLENYY